MRIEDKAEFKILHHAVAVKFLNIKTERKTKNDRPAAI
jgi:hypothetical protein